MNQLRQTAAVASTNEAPPSVVTSEVHATTLRTRSRFRAVRRVNATTYEQILLISAVATVLGLRAYLEATGYPKVGGNGLHIAHMLWGGLLMLVALVMLFSFVGAHARVLAAWAAGIGFGLFIDELGKFITSDNDYFFQPTVGLLYILFVALFLTFRALDIRRPLEPGEALANAADALPDLVIAGATPTGRARALGPLEASRTVGPLATAVQMFVDAAPRIDEGSRSLPIRMAVWTHQTYRRLIAMRWFDRAIVIVFLANAVLGLLMVIGVVLVLVAVAIDLGQTRLLTELSANPPESGWVAEGVSGAASLVSLIFAVIGALHLPRNRLAALRWFERSVVVSLLLVDPINFFSFEFGALGGLAFDLILWAGVSYLIRQEVSKSATNQAS